MAEKAGLASQRIADVLADRILDGRLPPGTRIKQEELAAELDASRIPVREALRILSSRGLVKLQANAGAWVASMTMRDLQQSYEIRERIEPLLLQDSIPRLTESDVQELRGIQGDIEHCDRADDFLRLDREFHWTTYRGHRSPQLADMVGRLWDSTQSYRHAFLRLTGWQVSWVTIGEHQFLLEAIENCDVDSAERILSLHIRRTRVALSRHPELFD